MIYLLVAATFFVATGGILFEIFLGAFGSYIFGDSVKVFSVTTGVYMFSMGIGAFSIRHDVKSPWQKLFLTEMGLVVLHLVAPFLIWWAFVNGFGANIVFWTVMVLSGILVGTEIPFLLALARAREGSSDSRIHQVLASDYFGALFASLAFGFVFLPKVGLIGTAAFSALTEVLGAALLVIWGLKTCEKKQNILAAGMATFVGLFLTLVLFFNAETIQTKLEKNWLEKSIGLNAKMLHSEWSGISHINLIEFEEPPNQIKRQALLLDRQIQWVTNEDLHYYHELLTVPAVESFFLNSGHYPKKVLVLGGGDGFVASKLFSLYGIKNIRVVDIDKRIQELAGSQPLWHSLGGWIFDQNSVQTVNTDAFAYVLDKNHPDIYDLIVFDLPDPKHAGLARFFTPSFFHRIYERLSPTGHLSIQASSSPQTPGGRQKFVCSLQNSLTLAGFFSRVLIGDEKDFYIVATKPKFKIPPKEKKLPGQFLKNGQQLLHFLTDSGKNFGKACPKLAINSILQPQILGY